MIIKIPFSRRAFTVLELLVVVVVLGILAALALARFANVQERAYVATMQSDLRNFASARALHLAEKGSPPMTIQEVEGYGFSKGVHDISYSDNASGWLLRVGHDRSESVCALSVPTSGSAMQIECVDDYVPNQSPRASFETDREFALPGEPLIFTSTSTDPENDELEAMWDFDSNGTIDAVGTTVSHLWTEGATQVTLTVRDPGGSEDAVSRELSVATLQLAYTESNMSFTHLRGGGESDSRIAGGVYPPLPEGMSLVPIRGCVIATASGASSVVWVRGGSEGDEGAIRGRIDAQFGAVHPSFIGQKFCVYIHSFTFMGRRVMGVGTRADELVAPSGETLVEVSSLNIHMLVEP